MGSVYTLIMMMMVLMIVMMMMVMIQSLLKKNLHIDGAPNVSPLVHSGAHHKTALMVF